ncbi:MAG: DegT/DnrJ/EryC1/StrS family aminotransferase [Alphaproteobacteria bacterium]|nr:DegT/DnrJ/EryC1/StrS family aminotransferase [Alphaproteobacteria bacterium]
MTASALSRIHYAKPSITEREVSYATDAAANGWGEKCYDYIYRFRDLLKAYLDVPYVIPTSSCTGALHLALAALDIGAGDEVIVPDITWIASVSPITYLGATPVFVDVLEDSWCIDPKAIEAAITSKTKAIIPVHLYGNLCDMDAIMAIAKRHGIAVIEDAAEALGSVYKGRKAASIGDMATFSFHGTKTVTTGEGGALVVQSPELYEKLLILEGHGRDPKISKQFWCEKIGYKYKMSNMEAAVGTAQMERIDELVARKREIFAQYQARLGKVAGLHLNPEPEGCINSYWMSTVVFDKSISFHREELLADMAAANIDARVFFYPVSQFPSFASKPENVVSYGLYDRAINLPSYHDIRDDEIARVCEVILAYLGKVSHA